MGKLYEHLFNFSGRILRSNDIDFRSIPRHTKDLRMELKVDPYNKGGIIQPLNCAQVFNLRVIRPHPQRYSVRKF